jgi:signal transduction histidine kinase
VDRLNPVNGHVHRYTAADGLAQGEVQTAIRDRNGVLWFGAAQGVSRFVPPPAGPHMPPPVRITRIRLGAGFHGLPEMGATEVQLPPLAGRRNYLEIQYAGISFASGEVLRYQRRLDGADEEWSSPDVQASAIYTHLAPGAYRFLVRAVNSDGGISPQAAAVSFRVLPPVYLRWWFLSLSCAMAGSLLYAAHRYRVKRLLQMERLRMQIASDLHDEIGSGLSQIAILSEVAQRNTGPVNGSMPLPRIAEISRELVNATADLVWAIQPGKDRMADLTQRMRRFAGEMFEAAGIEFDFDAADLDPERNISLDARRQIYLIFRESVRNVIRHARCRRAQICFRQEDGWLVLRVADDGIGTPSSSQREGYGFDSMRARALALNGEIEWTSINGTTVTLRVPLPK